MGLREEMQRQGQLLFRWRSYLPFLLVPLAVAAAVESLTIKAHFGDFLEDCWKIFCLAVSFAGFAMRCYVVGHAPGGTSGRNTRQQRAATLNTTGAYSIVRHPLYFGNFMIYFGMILETNVWWFVLLATALYMLYYERIILTEEEFLRQTFGAAFEQWASRTPVIVPRFQWWQPPTLPFSLRNVLRREYNGFLLIAVVFAAFELVDATFLTADFAYDVGWLLLLGFAVVAHLTLLALKRCTTVLTVVGR
jgi:protein-S-isoprenylcysteine O-methyltransferase Ste14